MKPTIFILDLLLAGLAAGTTAMFYVEPTALGAACAVFNILVYLRKLGS